MGGTPNVAGMIADPDFQGLSPADKRAALGKVTGDKSFADLNDGETMQFVSRFQKPQAQLPGAGTSIGPDQRGWLQRINDWYTRKPDYEGTLASPGRSPQQITQAAAQGVGVASLPLLGAAAVAAPAATALGIAGGAGGAYAGGKAGEWAGGKVGAPELGADIGGGVGGLVGGFAGAKVGGAGSKFVGKQVAKLFGETPERIAALKALPQQEAAINQKIAQAEVQSRTAFKDAYPKIDAAPVNVAATKNLARQAGENIVSARVPAQINRVAAIPEPYQNVLSSDDPNVILKELAAFDNIPFRKAQLYRTAIEKYISQAGGKLPSDVYGQLKQISGSLGDALRVTADREGVLPQFNTAEAMFKAHASDFWNKGAPLKPFASIPPNATGATVNKFIQTAQQGRILQALERRGVATDDIKGILAKGVKQVKADFRDAATLQNLGQPVLNRQVAKANRLSVLKATPYVIGGATGLGALEEYLRRQVFRKVAAK